jgi:hypothetical protein
VRDLMLEVGVGRGVGEMRELIRGGIGEVSGGMTVEMSEEVIGEGRGSEEDGELLFTVLDW